MIKKIVIFSMLLFSAQQSLAECEATGCSSVSIERLYVNTSGVVYIGSSGDEKLLDCNAASNVYVTLNMGEAGSNAVFSTLLAAQSSGKKVSLRTQNGSQDCKVLYVTLDQQ